MHAVPPPSETIFIKSDQDSNLFLYDHNIFMYAPEINLYLEITNKGYDAFYDNYQNVWRYPSSYKQRSWKYFHDSFKIISIYKNHYLITSKLLRNTKNSVILKTVGSYFVGLFKREIKDSSFKREIINEIGYFNFLLYAIYFFISKGYRMLLVKFH